MKRQIGWFLTIAVAVLGGCQKEGVNNTTSTVGTQVEQGILEVRLTDSPALYDEVNIVVDSVRVHVDSSDSVGGWYTLSRVPAMYNLLDYTNGEDTLIAEGPVSTGYYSQIRLYIGDGCNIVQNGSTHPLEVPSGSQSGLKLNVQATILPGVRYVARLDFDASRSILMTGNGRYKLKPVIKVLTDAVSGSMTGIIAPDTAYATVRAIVGTDTSTTLADSTGYFAFESLLPATYMLTIVPADTMYRDTTLTGIGVFAGQNTDVGTIILQGK
jgi:Domain of unknown function (DUF4382)